ncbi:MAG: hypothetical protein NZ840_11175 [Anaerolineales bacterium]|nr:hypothetical protein [Anaerolineales bacterium]MDW8162600.1 hypothetical protein [Anaerolineales bacterium]
MDDYHHIWLKWAKTLHRWGVAHLGYHLLSELGGMNLVLAQFIYLLEPLFYSQPAGQALSALCALLEEEVHREQFLTLLKEQGSVVS